MGDPPLPGLRLLRILPGRSSRPGSGETRLSCVAATRAKQRGTTVVSPLVDCQPTSKRGSPLPPPGVGTVTPTAARTKGLFGHRALGTIARNAKLRPSQARSTGSVHA